MDVEVCDFESEKSIQPFYKLNVNLLDIFPANFSLEDVFPMVAAKGRSASSQGGIQAISLAVTLGMALVGGLLVGRFTSLL